MQNISHQSVSEPQTRVELVATRVFSLKSFCLGFYQYFTKKLVTIFLKRIDQNSCARLPSAHLRCRSSALFRQLGDMVFCGSIPTFDLGNPPGLRDRRLREKELEKLQS